MVANWFVGTVRALSASVAADVRSPRSRRRETALMVVFAGASQRELTSTATLG